MYTAATRFLVAGQLGNTAISMAAQPRFTELFAVGDRRSANVIYQVTTAWLVLLTWPLYLLAIVYGPEVLSVFGHSYQAGRLVMLILGLTMLLATACGQVDMVLITTGRSSWSLVNGLAAVVVNVGLDLVLIPRYGITGAAIGWAVAIIVTNLMPMAQLASSIHLNPFGRGTILAAGLSALSFCAIPFAVRAALGPSAAASAGAVLAGCVVQAAGLWWFRDTLRLAALPGVSRLAKTFPFRLIQRGGPTRQNTAFLIWPAGLAVIFGVAALLARRARARPAGPESGPRLPWLKDGPVLRSAEGISRVRGAIRQAGLFLLIIVAGAAVVFAVMALLGQLVRHGGPSVDKPLYHWVVTHRIHHWKGLTNSADQDG